MIVLSLFHLQLFIIKRNEQMKYNMYEVWRCFWIFVYFCGSRESSTFGDSAQWSTHHPEEGSCGEICILFYSGQYTEDKTHQDHKEAVWRQNRFSSQSSPQNNLFELWV